MGSIDEAIKLKNKKNTYEKITDHSRELIKETAAQHVKDQRKKGAYKPISFSTLDENYYNKFHEIYEKVKQERKGTTKLDVFKILVDSYNQ